MVVAGTDGGLRCFLRGPGCGDGAWSWFQHWREDQCGRNIVAGRPHKVDRYEQYEEHRCQLLGTGRPPARSSRPCDRVG